MCLLLAQKISRAKRHLAQVAGNQSVFHFFYYFHLFQAFLEMGTEEAAITMINYYTTVTPHIRNVPVFVQYSNHKELKTDAGNQVRPTDIFSFVSSHAMNTQLFHLDDGMPMK